MERQRLGRSVIAVLLLLLSTCGPQVPTTNVTPAAAMIYVTGEPVAATSARSVQLVNADQAVLAEVTFAPGERIVAQLSAMPGTYTLRDGGGACTLGVTVDGGQESDVVLDQTGDGCNLTVVATHVAGEGPHSFLGTLTVTLEAPAAAGDAAVKLRSLDDPANPVPGPVRADESGRYFIESLAPGRYEVQVIEGGAVVATEDVEIGTGAQAEVSVAIEVSVSPSSQAE
jgi:hypothetical protein